MCTLAYLHKDSNIRSGSNFGPWICETGLCCTTVVVVVVVVGFCVVVFF